jgi:hypothetical protein
MLQSEGNKFNERKVLVDGVSGFCHTNLFSVVACLIARNIVSIYAIPHDSRQLKNRGSAPSVSSDADVTTNCSSNALRAG